MSAYYNENDPFAAAWLKSLAAAGLIAPGDVDDRDIRDVTPSDLAGYTQHHFFAGIGVWSYALRRAGWPDDCPVWTGSCPCQPFSSSGRGEGFADERHLWPHWHHLIEVFRPGTILGEQVSSKAGLAWLDLVQADLQASEYAVAPFDLCSAGVGAPHIRQRLYWVANADGAERLRGLGRSRDEHEATGWNEGTTTPSGLCEASRVGDADREHARRDAGASAEAQGGAALRAERDGAGTPGDVDRPSAPHVRGRATDWLFCRDGKWRPVEPGTFPLAHGATNRVGRLRGYGNSIDAELATAFVEAYMETLQ